MTSDSSNCAMQADAGLPSRTPSTWDPQLLLNPKATANPNPAAPLTRLPNASLAAVSYPRRAMTTPSQIQQITYSFSNANEHGNIDSSHDMEYALPAQHYAMDAGLSNGYSRHIERLNNVQDRSQPPPKRRKTEADNDTPMSNGGFGGRSVGVLDDFSQTNQGRPEKPKHENPSKKTMVDLTEADPDVMEITPHAPGEEEVCYGMLHAMINAHRVPSPKPGMMAIGGEGWWPQIKVVLRRKHNDLTKTITVYDCTRQTFGVIDAKTADALCLLLDQHFLNVRTDCRIATRRINPGEDVGQEVSCTYTVEVVLYGPRKYGVPVGNQLMKRGLHLTSPTRVQPGLTVENPHVQDSRAAAGRWSSTAARSGSSQNPTAAAARSVEELRSQIVNVFDSLPKSDHLPEMTPDARITTDLLKHQRQALYFMTKREQDTVPDGQDGSSCWQRRRDQHGEFYFNVITGLKQREPPCPTRGGILADMMGLGKTLSVLSLVTKTMGEASEWSAQTPVQPTMPDRSKSSGPQHFNVPKPQALGLTPLRKNGRGTLLICPLSTITNWEEQIKQHIRPTGISYHIYHGPSRIRDINLLVNYDLVITTYGSVSSELTARSKNKRPSFPLEEIGWFRVVLDEAHIIREQNTLAFKAICRLQASRRWAVTGTPIQNRLEDLGSLLSFLRVAPFDEKSKFLHYIIAPFKNADPEVVPKLRVLVDTITLRRLKDKIDLPPRVDEIVKLRFTKEEQDIYDPFNENAKDRLRALTRNDQIAGGKTYMHILRAILRLRLICAHGKDLLNDEDLAILEGMTAATPIELDSDDDEDGAKPALAEAKAYGMFYVLQETGEDACRRCNQKLGSNEAAYEAELDSERQQDDLLGYMAPCFHIFCPACANILVKGPRSGADAATDCAACANFDKRTGVELRSTRADAEHESHNTWKGSSKGNGKAYPERYTGPHTKTRALVAELLKLKKESAKKPNEPPYKSVIFSGWTSHLDLIELALNDAGITFRRLDGKMTRTQRTHAMDQFRENPAVQVILVSIMAGGMGLNLTSANSVFVMEPQYNPAAEAQAVDRVHRLGQKRPVRIVRFIMENSFEESILMVQKKKTDLANLSMDGRDKDKVMNRTESARQRLLELRSLFR